MSNIDIRIPNIATDAPASQQMAQMRSYMYQLVEQLNWALNAIQSAQNGDSTDVVIEGVDVGDDITQANETTFNSIKGLIIKSADIVNAYYDEMKQRYDGEYVAQSDFGIYQQQVSQEITQNAEGISQLFTNVQSIESDVTSIESEVIASKAWINSGLLGYDEGGSPIYGVEVGQRTTTGGVETFNKYARFTASGIYFYLPGATNAVAWMTGTKLYITNAEITNSLKLGHYIVDLSHGVTFKWAGG